MQTGSNSSQPSLLLTPEGLMVASITRTHGCTAAHPEHQPICCGVLTLLWHCLVASLAPSLPFGRWCGWSCSQRRLAGSGSLRPAAGRRLLPLLVFPLQHRISFHAGACTRTREPYSTLDTGSRSPGCMHTGPAQASDAEAGGVGRRMQQALERHLLHTDAGTSQQSAEAACQQHKRQGAAGN